MEELMCCEIHIITYHTVIHILINILKVQLVHVKVSYTSENTDF